MQGGLKMDARRSTNELNRRLIREKYSWAFSSEKLVHKRKKEFLMILIAILIFGLIMAFLFAQMPITGENYPMPGYP
jgi:hypothetical protein